MTYVSYLLMASDTPNIVYLSGCILITHLDKTEVPELAAVRVRVQRPMLSTVFTAALVTDPNVVASPSKLKSWRHILLIGDPTISGRNEAVLQQNGRLLLSEECGRAATLFILWCLISRL